MPNFVNFEKWKTYLTILKIDIDMLYYKTIFFSPVELLRFLEVSISNYFPLYTEICEFIRFFDRYIL